MVLNQLFMQTDTVFVGTVHNRVTGATKQSVVNHPITDTSNVGKAPYTLYIDHGIALINTLILTVPAESEQCTASLVRGTKSIARRTRFTPSLPIYTASRD